MFFFFFSSRRRHTRFDCDWSSDVCSSDLSGHRLCRGVREHPVTGALAIMPVGYFQVKLSLRPTAGGGAELLPPQAIQELPHHFVIVKEGGEEALIQIGRASCRERV